MPTLQEKRLAYLEDTIQHYNSNNRAVKPDRKCVYIPVFNEHGEKISDGCAIGRKCSLNIAEKLSKTNCSIDMTESFNLLTEEMKELGVGFLVSIQKLHDSPDCWNAEGISEIGKEKVMKIKNRFI